MNEKWKRICGLALGTGAAYLAYRALADSQESFENQTVIITGGGRGLGLELARVWCQEGANVAICGRDEETLRRAIEELRSYGTRVFSGVCDVTDRRAVQHFIRNVREEMGPIDVLANVAGIIEMGPLTSFTEEDYERSLATHFWGPYHAISAVLPEMLQRRRGRIINISSIGGDVVIPHLLPYCTSKHALIGFSEGLALELRSRGIAVTTVAPGLMRTGSPRHGAFKGRHRAEYAIFSIGASLPVITINSAVAARRIVEASRRRLPRTNVSWVSAISSRLRGMAPGTFNRFVGWIAPALPSCEGEQCTEPHKGWQSFSNWSPSLLTTLNEHAAARNNEL